MQAFTKLKNSFTISKKDINLYQTLSCGQIFSYKQINSGYLVFSGQEFAYIKETIGDYLVRCDNVDYFKNFFDLNTNYDKIKETLVQFEVMKAPIEFGGGIRILRQDILETIISFVISANNNIKRITNTVFYLREHFGNKIGNFYAFPTLIQLEKITEQDFRSAGAGYRSPQLVRLIKELKNSGYERWGQLETEVLKNKLVALSGIGPKVADCIMLFAYGKTDVFPVDTWIEKVYNNFFQKCTDRKEIRRKLVDKFKNFSGFAQQYLFFYQRENKL